MSLFQLIDRFYERLPEDSFAREPCLGQLGWTVVPIPYAVPQILDVRRSDARSHDEIVGTLRNMQTDDFKRSDTLPIYRLQLRKNEALMVQRAKRRLGIVVSLFGSRFDDVDRLLRSAGKKHLQEQNIVVAPIYPHQSEDHPDGFPPVVRSRIEALMYSQFFPCSGNQEPFVLGGAARLDRMLPVVPQMPTWQPLSLKISSEALAVLHAQIRLRAGSREEPELDTIREILKDAIPPAHGVTSQHERSGP